MYYALLFLFEAVTLAVATTVVLTPRKRKQQPPRETTTVPQFATSSGTEAEAEPPVEDDPPIAVLTVSAGPEDTTSDIVCRVRRKRSCTLSGSNK